MATLTEQQCDCGNRLKYEHEQAEGKCEWCSIIDSEPPHEFRWSTFGTTLWCVTCNSPYCNLL